MIVTVLGQKELIAVLKKCPVEAKTAAAKELKIAAESLEGKATILAPIDTGALRGSHYSIPTGELEMEVGFTMPYATRQHEEVGYNHPRGGQAKYLEEPFKANIYKYIKNIGDAIRRAVKG
jgi:hypothetical protein